MPCTDVEKWNVLMERLEPKSYQTFFYKQVSTCEKGDGYAEYYGELDSKLRFDGEGSLLWPNGDFYTGSFSKGKIHGEGTVFFAESGNMYTGQMKNNKIDMRSFIDTLDEKDRNKIQATKSHFDSFGSPPVLDKKTIKDAIKKISSCIHKVKS